MKLGIYRHYKGNEYRIIGLVCHSETNEKLVLYKALYDCPDLEEEFELRPYFVRPYEMFLETIEREGKMMPRFERVRE